MLNKNNGVTLLEILVVLAIFTVVSIGVTNLTVKSMEFQKDKETTSYQTSILDSIQTDLRRDLTSAHYVWVSNGSTPSLNNTTTFATLGSCTSPPTNPTGTDLNIVQYVGPSSIDVQQFRYIRYEFININGIPSLVRTSNPQNMADSPLIVGGLYNTIWPKELDSSKTSLPNSFVSYTSGISKVYNPVGSASELESITGTFQAIFDDGINPSTTWATTNCTYTVRAAAINGLTIQPSASSYSNIYDKAFGSKNRITIPSISFDISGANKFF